MCELNERMTQCLAYSGYSLIDSFLQNSYWLPLVALWKCLSFLQQTVNVCCTSGPMLGAGNKLVNKRTGSFLLRPHVQWTLKKCLILLPPSSPAPPRGSKISHTYFKTFSVSTFCSGFSFSASLSGTKRWMLDLARVVSFFQPLQRSMWNGMKSALWPLHQLSL